MDRTGPLVPASALRRTLTVDFYLYSSHEVAVWEPVWRALRQRGVDAQVVLEPPGIHRAMGSVPDATNGWFNEKDTDIVPLVDEATFHSLAGLLDQQGLPWIEHSRVDADAVITTQGIGWLEHYRGQRIKIEYGASAFVDVYGHGPINNGLDAVLAHGPFSARAISAEVPQDRIHQVGYPKWAPAQRAGVTREEARAALELPDSQPIVAWLPTWAHNATIDRYAMALAQLADHYVVVAKPHHNNVRFETERLAALDPRIVVRADLHSLVPLMLAADVVVADGRSGALAETFIADRPAVGLLPGIGAVDNGIIAGLDDAVVWCREPEHLQAAVADALTTDRSHARQQWRPWLFASDTEDAVRAADVIIDLLQRGHELPTTGLPLRQLDLLIDQLADLDNDAFLAAFSHGWTLWPGHPRLAAALATTATSLSPEQLLHAARLVRVSGHREVCPVMAVIEDPTADPVARVTAAAVAADLFEEATADSFVQQVAALPSTRYQDALSELDLVPRAIPAFIECAATDPERCTGLASALRALGAEEQAVILLDHAERLVAP